MAALFKKDLLIFWRDRKQILLAILTPVVLVVVLHFVFSGLLGDNAEGLNMDVAIVWEDDEAAAMEQLAARLELMNLSQSDREAMMQQAALLSPGDWLRDFLDDPDLQQWIRTQPLTEEEAVEGVENGSLNALVKIPQGFAYSVLRSVLLDEPADTVLAIRVAEQSNQSDLLQNVIDGFLGTLNFQFALGHAAGGEPVEPVLPHGGMEYLEEAALLTLAQYFTIAMSALFALFIATTVAAKTVTEKRERVFNRIQLTNSHPLAFLLGKVLSTFSFVWLQLMSVFIVSDLLMDVFAGKSIGFWLGTTVVITAFSLTVAGLSAVFTSLTLQINDGNAANGLFTLVVMLMGAVGGSFFPLTEFPEWLQRSAKWTPNGLSLSVLSEWLQYGDPEALVVPVMVLLAFFGGCLIIGAILFPGRGRT